MISRVTVLRCAQCDRPLTIPAVQAPPPPPHRPDVASSRKSRPSSSIRRSSSELARVATETVAGCGSSPWPWSCWPSLGAVPVAIALLQPRDLDLVHLERWACAVLLVGMLELSYAVYLLQLPDWSSLRVVSFVTLGIAAVYAAVAGIRLLAASGNRVMEFWELDGNVFSSSQEALWCFLMVLLTGSLSYLAGRCRCPMVPIGLHDASTGNSVSGH